MMERKRLKRNVVLRLLQQPHSIDAVLDLLEPPELPLHAVPLDIIVVFVLAAVLVGVFFVAVSAVQLRVRPARADRLDSGKAIPAVGRRDGVLRLINDGGRD